MSPLLPTKRDTFATYQFAKTWLRNKQLVVADISARCTGNDCFYVSAHEGCDFAAWKTSAREHITVAHKTMQSLCEKTAEFVDQVIEARKMPDYDVIVSFVMAGAKEALMGENVNQDSSATDVLAAWKLALTHCNALQRVWQSGPLVRATRSASFCSRDPQDSAVSTPLFANRADCIDWTVCSRTNTHDIALRCRGKTLKPRTPAAASSIIGHS
jgi:hypothetical protein